MTTSIRLSTSTTTVRRECKDKRQVSIERFTHDHRPSEYGEYAVWTPTIWSSLLFHSQTITIKSIFDSQTPKSIHPQWTHVWMRTNRHRVPASFIWKFVDSHRVTRLSRTSCECVWLVVWANDSTTIQRYDINRIECCTEWIASFQVTDHSNSNILQWMWV